MTGRNNIKKIIIYILSVFIFFVLWSVLAHFVDAPLILPSINLVFIKITELLTIESFWINLLHTFFRVFVSFFISLFIGFTLGLLAGLFPLFKSFIDIPLSFIRSTPVVAIILITLFWFNSSSVPIFVCVLMCLPIVITATCEGINKNDKNLMFMAKVYKLNNWQKIRYIKLNDLIPFLENSAISVFGLSWKVVVAGEVLTLPKYGFGSLMQTAQVHLETDTVIAITFILVFFSFVLEKIFSFIIRKLQKNHGGR